jgi:hypothetical protein
MYLWYPSLQVGLRDLLDIDISELSNSVNIAEGQLDLSNLLRFQVSEADWYILFWGEIKTVSDDSCPKQIFY